MLPAAHFIFRPSVYLAPLFHIAVLQTVLLCSVTVVGAQAQEEIIGGGVILPPSNVYRGPGDIVSGATAYYGLRAYDAAIVTTGTQALVNLRRSSDSHTCDIIVSTSGGLGNTGNCSSSGDNGSTLLSWTTRGTFTGTAAASTTMTTTGDPCAATAGDQVTWTGIASATYVKISSVTSCSAGIGSYVLSASETFTAVTVTDYIPSFATELYDQTGNSNNVMQGTAADQPALYFNCVGTLGCLYLDGSSQYLSNSSGTTTAGGSYIVSAERTGVFTTSKGMMATGPSITNRVVFTSSANSIGISTNNTTNITLSATDSEFHNIQGVANTSGNTSYLYADGTGGSNTNGNPQSGASFTIGSSGSSSNSFTGYLTEGAFWNNTYFTTTQIGNECHNQYEYWGGASSC